MRTSAHAVMPALSAPWLVAGLSLFALSVMTPVAVVVLSDGQIERAPALGVEKAADQTLQPSDKGNQSEFWRHISEAEIIPGLGLGDVVLGDAASAHLHRLPSQTISYFESGGDLETQVYDVPLGTASLQIVSRSDDGLIDEVRMVAPPCFGPTDAMQPWTALPALSGGISIGSHKSRVLAQLGEPQLDGQNAIGPMMPTTWLTYDGLRVRLCQSTQIVTAIVVRKPDTKPGIADLLAALSARGLAVPEELDTEGPSERLATDAARGPEPDSLRSAYRRVTRHAPAISPVGPARAPEQTQMAAAGIPGEAATLAGIGAPAMLPVKRGPRSIAEIPADAGLSPAQLDTAHPDVRPTALVTAVEQAPQTGFGTAIAPMPAIDLQLPQIGALADRGPSVQTTVLHSDVPSDLPPELVVAAAMPDLPESVPALLAQTPVNAVYGPIVAISTMSAPQIDGSDVAHVAHAAAPRPEAVLAVAALPESVSMLHASTTEGALKLSNRKVRAVQLRLLLLGHDPRGIDGTLGDNSRKAVAAFQETLELTPTGYLDADLIETLYVKAKPRYRAWRAEQRAKEVRLAARAEPVLKSQIPAARRSPECARDANGIIRGKQSISCDFNILGEGLSALLGLRG
ncbi:MAG: peptidoglycan-binding protein [Pseudomonadota bacterium]